MKKKIYSDDDMMTVVDLVKMLMLLPEKEQEKFLYMIKGAAIICGAEVRT